MAELTRTELKAWRRYLDGASTVFQAIDQQLKRDADMTSLDYGIMSALADERRSAARMTTLAERLLVSPSRLSHAVDRLERRGWVMREDGTSDGRVRMARLTDEGRAATEAAWPKHAELIRELLIDQLSEDELSTIEEVSARISRVVQ